MMTVSSLFLLLPILIVMEVQVALSIVMGEYDIKLDHIDNCDKKGEMKLLTNMRVDKLNRTHFIYSGLVDTGVDIDDTVKIRAHALLKQPSGRYSTVIDVKYKACELIKIFALGLVESVFEHCNSTFQCPVKRWTCEMKNWVVHIGFENIPALPFGDYKLDCYILRHPPLAKEEFLSCLRIYGSVYPKYEKKKIQ